MKYFVNSKKNNKINIKSKASERFIDILLKKDKNFYSWVLAIIAILAVAIACHKIFIVDKAIFVLDDTDSFSQFMYFFPFLQNAFLSGNPFWSFSYGLGGNVFGEFSYYYTTSPFFYLMLIVRIITAQPWDFHMALYSKMILSILKQFLCMFFMFSLLKYEGRKTLNALIGAVVYGAALIFTRYSVAFDFMTDAYVWVPLTILGFNIYKRTKKSFVLLLGAAITVGNSFYFGFMSFVFYFIYMLIFAPSIEGKSIRDNIIGALKTYYKYILYALLAIGISCIFLIPSLYALFSSDRFSSELNINPFFNASFYKELPERLFNNRDILALPIISLICLILPIKKVSNETRKKTALALLFFIFYLLPYVYSFFSGLSHTYDRWLYLFIFTVAYALPNWLEENDKFKFADIRYIVVVGGILVYMYVSKSSRGLGAVNRLDMLMIICSSIEVLAIVASKYFKENWQEFVLKSIVFISVSVNLIGFSNYYLDNVSGIHISESAFEKLGIENPEEQAIFSDLTPGTDDFYRDIFVDLESQNAPLNYGYYGVSVFNSLINGNLHRWMKRDFNILQKIVITSLYLNLDDRLFLETALGVKYKVIKKDGYLDSYGGYRFIKVSDNFEVYENKNVVGLDMWYENAIDKSVFDSASIAERDAMLLQGAVVEKNIEGIEKTPPNDVTKKLELDWDNAELNNIEYKDEMFIVKENASIKLSIKNLYKDTDGEVLCIVNIKPTNGQDIDLNINGKLGNKASEDWTWTYPINDFTFKYDGSTDVFNITLSEGEYRVGKFEAWFNSYETYPQLVQDRNKYNLENLYVNGGTVRGDLKNEEKGILALSIPFDKGWTLKIDGKRQEILKVNGTFIGVLLDKGDHHIELKYLTPGILSGGIITSCSIALAVFLFLKNKKTKIA